MREFNELLKEVGRKYQMFNDDESYQGCFYPVQFLYPDKPKYKLRSKDDDKNYMYGISKIKKHCVEIEKDQLQKGDIVATRFRDELHVAVYYEFGKIIHVFKDHTLQIGRLSMFKDYTCFRVQDENSLGAGEPS